MQELRVLTCEIAGNPNSHPLTKDNKGWGIRVNQSTKGIDRLLLNRDMSIGLNADEIILYITHAHNITFGNVVTELGTASMNMRR